MRTNEYNDRVIRCMDLSPIDRPIEPHSVDTALYRPFFDKPLSKTPNNNKECRISNIVESLPKPKKRQLSVIHTPDQKNDT